MRYFFPLEWKEITKHCDIERMHTHMHLDVLAASLAWAIGSVMTDINERNPRTQHTSTASELHITHRNTQLKKSFHLLEKNLDPGGERGGAPISKQGWKSSEQIMACYVGKNDYKTPWPLDQYKQTDLFNNCSTAHGADSTASVGRKELYAKEGSECKGLVDRWG